MTEIKGNGWNPKEDPRDRSSPREGRRIGGLHASFEGLVTYSLLCFTVGPSYPALVRIGSRGLKGVNSLLNCAIHKKPLAAVLLAQEWLRRT